MTTAVAMCTYNGATYIREQLESILNQTKRVDGIVVCDDCSTDDTLTLLENFRERSSVPIHIVRNTTNLGYFANFVQALRLTSADIVFLADQDDIWRNDKVAKIVEFFQSHEECDVLFTDARLIDGRGMDCKETLWTRVGFSQRKRKYFRKGYGLEIFASGNRATGATMAFRKTFLQGIEWTSYGLPLVHDQIISFVAVALNRMCYLSETLTDYRLHGKQTIGIRRYAPLFYSPLRAYTLDLGPVKNLPSWTMKRIAFLREREKNYTIKKGWIRILRNSYIYIHIYKNWWYKFWIYDFSHSLKHFLLSR